MRMIGQLDSEADAKRFSDYLLTVDVDAHIEESASGAWQVWIEHDDDLDKGTAELEAFRAAPDDPKFGDAKSVAAKIRREEEKAAERRRKNFRDVRTSQSFGGAGRYATPVAVMLVLACVLLFALPRLWPDRPDAIKPLLIFDASPPPAWLDERGEIVFERQPLAMFDDITHGQVWRLVTPMLLHGGVLHILFNMMWLWRLGQVIESVKGSGRFLLLVLVISATSCAMQAAWYEVLGTWGIFVGMSGVNAGLLGYAWMKRKYQSYEGIGVTDQEIGLMIGWLVICSLGVVANIANAAHWGGLVTGMLIGAGPTLWRRMRRA